MLGCVHTYCHFFHIYVTENQIFHFFKSLWYCLLSRLIHIESTKCQGFILPYDMSKAYLHNIAMIIFVLIGHKPEEKEKHSSCRQHFVGYSIRLHVVGLPYTTELSQCCGFAKKYIKHIQWSSRFSKFLLDIFCQRVNRTPCLFLTMVHMELYIVDIQAIFFWWSRWCSLYFTFLLWTGKIHWPVDNAHGGVMKMLNAVWFTRNIFICRCSSLKNVGTLWSTLFVFI